jgi:putative cheA signal transduction histidine kinase
LALECEKCANKNVAIRQGMGTAAGGLMLLNGVVGTVGVLKSVF